MPLALSPAPSAAACWRGPASARAPTEPGAAGRHTACSGRSALHEHPSQRAALAGRANGRGRLHFPGAGRRLPHPRWHWRRRSVGAPAHRPADMAAAGGGRRGDPGACGWLRRAAAPARTRARRPGRPHPRPHARDRCRLRPGGRQLDGEVPARDRNRGALGNGPSHPRPPPPAPARRADAELLDAGYLATTYRAQLERERASAFRPSTSPLGPSRWTARCAKGGGWAGWPAGRHRARRVHTLAVRWRATPAVLAGRRSAALGWGLLLALLVGSLRGSAGAACVVVGERQWRLAGSALPALVAMMGWSERTLPAQP